MVNIYVNRIKYSGTRTEILGGVEVEGKSFSVTAEDACTEIDVPNIEAKANEIKTLCDNSFSDLKTKYDNLSSTYGDSIVIEGQNIGTLTGNIIGVFWNESGGVPNRIADTIDTIISSAYTEHNNRQKDLNEEAKHCAESQSESGISAEEISHQG